MTKMLNLQLWYSMLSPDAEYCKILLEPGPGLSIPFLNFPKKSSQQCVAGFPEISPCCMHASCSAAPGSRKQGQGTDAANQLKRPRPLCPPGPQSHTQKGGTTLTQRGLCPGPQKPRMFSPMAEGTLQI
jgi:hypothetical protein